MTRPSRGADVGALSLVGRSAVHARHGARAVVTGRFARTLLRRAGLRRRPLAQALTLLAAPTPLPVAMPVVLDPTPAA